MLRNAEANEANSVMPTPLTWIRTVVPLPSSNSIMHSQERAAIGLARNSTNSQEASSPVEESPTAVSIRFLSE
jgi:hypothetical protein